MRDGDLVHDDAEEAPRTVRGWVISGVVAALGFVAIALVMRIWWSWPDALTWSLVAVIGWIGVDVYSDIRRRRRQRTRST